MSIGKTRNGAEMEVSTKNVNGAEDCKGAGNLNVAEINESGRCAEN